MKRILIISRFSFVCKIKIKFKSTDSAKYYGGKGQGAIRKRRYDETIINRCSGGKIIRQTKNFCSLCMEGRMCMDVNPDDPGNRMKKALQLGKSVICSRN